MIERWAQLAVARIALQDGGVGFQLGVAQRVRPLQRLGEMEVGLLRDAFQVPREQIAIHARSGGALPDLPIVVVPIGPIHLPDDGMHDLPCGRGQGLGLLFQAGNAQREAFLLKLGVEFHLVYQGLHQLRAVAVLDGLRVDLEDQIKGRAGLTAILKGLHLFP
jgi:hypothetical protein